jgi:hypothetical protein
MKNPFVMMALMAAAMSDAFRENAYRNMGIAMPGGRGKHRSPGKKQPAGTKMILRFYRAKHGVKATSAEEARYWYAGYLADADANARASDAAAKRARIARNHPWLADRLAA